MLEGFAVIAFGKRSDHSHRLEAQESFDGGVSIEDRSADQSYYQRWSAVPVIDRNSGVTARRLHPIASRRGAFAHLFLPLSMTRPSKRIDDGTAPQSQPFYSRSEGRVLDSLALGHQRHFSNRISPPEIDQVIWSAGSPVCLGFDISSVMRLSRAPRRGGPEQHSCTEGHTIRT